MEKRWIPTYNVTPTFTRPSRWRGVRRYDVDLTDYHGGTHVRIFSHTLFTKTNIQTFFWVFSEGPRGSTPTFWNPSPNGTHLRIFPRISTAILKKILLRHSQTPTSPLRQHHVRIPLVALRILVFPASTSKLTILTKILLRHSQPPTSTLRQHDDRIPLVALRTLRFFPPLYLHFNIFMKRWNLTSNVTPYANPIFGFHSSRYLPEDFFSPLYHHFYILLKRVGPYLQRHPHLNTTFVFLSSRYLPKDFLRPLYHHFYIFMKRVEPYLQRHPYTNTIFGFPSSRYLPQDFSLPLYHHFYNFMKWWCLSSNVTPTPMKFKDKLMPCCGMAGMTGHML